MSRRLSQEHLLHAAGFEPIRPGARELWFRNDELYTRSRALLEALNEATQQRGGVRDVGRGAS